MWLKTGCLLLKLLGLQQGCSCSLFTWIRTNSPTRKKSSNRFDSSSPFENEWCQSWLRPDVNEGHLLSVRLKTNLAPVRSLLVALTPHFLRREVSSVFVWPASNLVLLPVPSLFQRQPKWILKLYYYFQELIKSERILAGIWVINNSAHFVRPLISLLIKKRKIHACHRGTSFFLYHDAEGNRAS